MNFVFLPLLGFFTGEASVDEAISAETAVSSDLASSCFVDHILSSSACILGLNVARSFQILSNRLMLLTVLLSIVCADVMGLGLGTYTKIIEKNHVMKYRCIP